MYNNQIRSMSLVIMVTFSGILAADVGKIPAPVISDAMYAEVHGLASFCPCQRIYRYFKGNYDATNFVHGFPWFLWCRRKACVKFFDSHGRWLRTEPLTIPLMRTAVEKTKFDRQLVATLQQRLGVLPAVAYVDLIYWGVLKEKQWLVFYSDKGHYLGAVYRTWDKELHEQDLLPADVIKEVSGWFINPNLLVDMRIKKSVSALGPVMRGVQSLVLKVMGDSSQEGMEAHSMQRAKK